MSRRFDPISSSHLGRIYSALWYELMALRGIGPVKATRFMFRGNVALGGNSPVEAIKAGRAAEVQRLIGEMS